MKKGENYKTLNATTPVMSKELQILTFENELNKNLPLDKAPCSAGISCHIPPLSFLAQLLKIPDDLV